MIVYVSILAGGTLLLAACGGGEGPICHNVGRCSGLDASPSPDASPDAGLDAGEDDGGGEICNGLDDDGDGRSDEGNPGAGLVCPTGLAPRCGQGRTTCLSGHLECAPDVPPTPEACDNAGVDDDCNDVTDDVIGLGGECSTGLDGACAAGTAFCDGTVLACQLDTQPVDEICDNTVDDDCDGETDEAGCVPDPG